MSQKRPTYIYFLNNSVKSPPILIIVSTQRSEES